MFGSCPMREFRNVDTVHMGGEREREREREMAVHKNHKKEGRDAEENDATTFRDTPSPLRVFLEREEKEDFLNSCRLEVPARFPLFLPNHF